MSTEPNADITADANRALAEGREHLASQPAEALKAFTRAISLRPETWIAYYFRGAALYQLQEPDRALQDYNRALVRLIDHHASVKEAAHLVLYEAFLHAGKARVHLSTRSWRLAIEEIETALQCDPTCLPGHQCLDGFAWLDPSYVDGKLRITRKPPAAATVAIPDFRERPEVR